MEKHKKIELNNLFTPWNIALMVAIAVALWLVWKYVPLIAISVLAAYIFSPLNRRMLKLYKDKKVAAAFSTVLLSLLIVVVPAIIIGAMIIFQMTHLIASIQTNFSTATDVINQIVHALNQWLGGLTGNFNMVSYEQVSSFIQNAIVSFGKWFVSAVMAVIGSFPGFITSLFLYVFITGALLAYQDETTEAVVRLNPMGSDISRMYITKAKKMTTAMLKGQFVTAFLQGTESALAFTLVGYGNLFFVMWPIFTFLSIIPLGAGIITIPLGIGMMLSGRVAAGLFIVLNHILIVSSIDNFTRPKFVSRDAYLPVAVTLLATFAGMARFGFLGIIYGPIIMILVVTTFDVYLNVNGYPVLFKPKEKQPQSNAIGRLLTGTKNRLKRR